MKHGNVVADNSFYSCHVCDLQRIEWLERYFSLYQFHYGTNLRSEMPKRITSSQCLNAATFHERDYSELFRPFIGRTPIHHNDGEYEAIGIACNLALTDDLAYLILDDRVPNKCAKRIAEEKILALQGKVIGTIGFIRDSHLKDQLLNQGEVLEILHAIHDRFQAQSSPSGKHRPCSMDPHVVENVLLPVIADIEARTHE